MRRSWTLLLLLAVAALAFAAGRRSAFTHPDFDPVRDLQAAHLTSLLGLSEAQAGELRSIETSYVARVSTACDSHCAARCELALSLGNNNFDTERARKLVDKMCASHRANEMATIEQIAQIRALLTPEQRAQFSSMIGQCLCGTCKPGSASCCAATNTDEEKGPAP